MLNGYPPEYAMKEKNKWQHKVNYKKSKEGYADVSYEDT